MTPQSGNGSEKSLGDIVQEVSEKASLLVRQEIELAKAEVTGKVKTLGKGAAVGAAAGAFLIFALVMALHTLAWLISDIFGWDPWAGFAIVTFLLIVLGAIAGLLAKKWLSEGPPTPELAIEQAKLTRQSLERQGAQRDQLERSHDRPNRSEEVSS
ncbi:MAG: phage holin family protein [Thermoleophilaceae bacterium]